MDRKKFIISLTLGISPLALFSDEKKSKKKKKNTNQKKSKKKVNAQTASAALTGRVALKPKDHDGAADDYYFYAQNKEYIISRTLYDKIEDHIGQQVTLYCTVMGGRKIIVINHVKK